MSASWPSVRLGEILKQADERIELRPDEQYQQVTVQLWGKGVTQRDVVYGSEIGASTRCIVRSGQFILSRIDARHGAFGLVPNSLEGAVASNDFPAFNVDQSRIIPEFLGWLSKTRAFIEICRKASEGTTNRVRLKIDRFLGTPIALPPIDEQRRIVARIEELATRIEEARGLRQRAVEEAQALYESAVNDVFQSIDTPKKASLGNLASKIGSGSTPKGGRAIYVEDGIPFIRSQNVRMRQFQWDDIAFITPEIHASMNGTHVLPDDVLLNITGASIGRVACAPAELEMGNVNQHVAIIRPKDQEVLRPRYLMYWLSQPTIQDFINSEQKGATRQGFTKRQIEAFEIPLIPPGEQDEFVSYLDRLQSHVDELKRLQCETSAELDALLPSILDKAFKGQM